MVSEKQPTVCRRIALGSSESGSDGALVPASQVSASLSAK